MKALFVARPGEDLDPWYPDFAAAIAGVCSHALLDRSAPLASQFAGVKVVVDLGGHGSDELVDVAAAAGVVLWQVMGTGLDDLSIPALRRRGLLVASTPGQLSSVALAEHAMFLMLALAKRYPEACRGLASGQMSRPMNRELSGATLCIVGFGASGRELAARAVAFGMHVDALDVARPDPTDLSNAGVRRFGLIEKLPVLLSTCDVVSIHVPLTHATEHLIDSAALSYLPRHATLINVSRGGVVDELALIDALKRGRLAGAGLDVFEQEPPNCDNPLFGMDNVVATPHVAGVTAGTSRRRAAACVENVRRVTRGETPLYLVEAEQP